MQTKQVISEIDFDNTIVKLNRLELVDDIQYIRDELGIRAVGAIYVGGNYEDSEGIRDFEEYIELDVLAPYDKLHDYNEFKVELAGYDYSIINGNLKLVIDLDIYGIYEDEEYENVIEATVEDSTIDMPIQFVEKSADIDTKGQTSNSYMESCMCDKNEEYETKHKECLELHKDIIHPNAFNNNFLDSNCSLNIDTTKYQIVDEHYDNHYVNEDNLSYENNDEIEELYDILDESIIFDDILDDQVCTMDCMKYYICDNNSNYEQISKKYNVDIKSLMKANNYKVIGDKSIVEIPND